MTIENSLVPLRPLGGLGVSLGPLGGRLEVSLWPLGGRLGPDKRVVVNKKPREHVIFIQTLNKIFQKFYFLFTRQCKKNAPSSRLKHFIRF